MNNTVPIAWDDVASTVPSTVPSTAPASPDRTPDRRHLRIAEVDENARTGKRSPVAGALISVAIILVILATQLGLSILISGGAYEMRALELEQRDLVRVERVLEQNVEKLSSPQNLVDNAAQLGMVQNSHPATLRLSDAKVLGALESATTDVTANNVPNDTLTSMPVIDAEGLMVPRGGQAAADDVLAELTPVPWKGKLPAPDTH